MKIKTIGVGIILGGLLLTGCSYKTATINYKKYNAYSQDLGGNKKYEEIGPITAKTTGFFWTNCIVLTSEALKQLKSKAEALGGNGVINVQWATDNGWSLTPTCETQWGWAVAYILPVFGPWVQHVTVQGVAIKFLNNKQKKESD